MLGALPTPTDAPAVGTISTDIASTASNAWATGYTNLLPYVVALGVLFGLAAYALRKFGIRPRLR